MLITVHLALGGLDDAEAAGDNLTYPLPRSSVNSHGLRWPAGGRILASSYRVRCTSLAHTIRHHEHKPWSGRWKSGWRTARGWNLENPFGRCIYTCSASHPRWTSTIPTPGLKAAGRSVVGGRPSCHGHDETGGDMPATAYSRLSVSHTPEHFTRSRRDSLTSTSIKPLDGPLMKRQFLSGRLKLIRPKQSH